MGATATRSVKKNEKQSMSSYARFEVSDCVTKEGLFEPREGGCKPRHLLRLDTPSKEKAAAQIITNLDIQRSDTKPPTPYLVSH